MDHVPFNATSTQVLSDTVNYLVRKMNYDDYTLLPLVMLGTSWIFNKGSILPKKDPLYYMFFERPQEKLGMKSQIAKRSRNIADAIHQKNADIVVFWGSQSGTAEGFAHRLAREAHQRFKLNALMADLSDYEAQSVVNIPDTTLAVFVMSTYGEGDPSDNAQEFVSWIHLANADFSSLRIAAFGCGNSNYRYYNKIIDGVVTALTKCGATSLTAVGRGNEATRTTDEDFLEWKDRMFSALALERGLTEFEPEYEPEVDVTEDPLSHKDVKVGEVFLKGRSKSIPSGHSEIASVPIIGRTELAAYAEENRSCIEIKVDLTSHAHIKYKTGDHLAVWPENSPDEVNTLIQILNLQEKRSVPIRINSRSGFDEPKVPSATTIEALFQYYLEICSPVPRETVLRVAQMAPSSAIKQGLQSIGNNRETYASFLTCNHLTFSGLLDFGSSFDPLASWSTLPLSFLRIISPRHVTLTVSVKPSVVGTNPRVYIPGITSSFLARAQVGEDTVVSRSNIRVQIRGSTFKLTINEKTPLVMVATRTVIAPLRAFVHERARLASIGKGIGQMMLFFRCQNKSDHLYSDQFKDLMVGALAGKLTLMPAFSRVGHKKAYVQDKIRQHRGDVLRLLGEEDAAFYVCGAATMAREVDDVLSESLKETKQWSEAQVQAWRGDRKKSKRWFEDEWS